MLALLSVKRPVSWKGGERIKGGWKVAGYQYLATGWSLLFLPPYLSGDKSNKGDGRYFPYNINPLLITGDISYTADIRYFSCNIHPLLVNAGMFQLGDIQYKIVYFLKWLN